MSAHKKLPRYYQNNNCWNLICCGFFIHWFLIQLGKKRIEKRRIGTCYGVSYCLSRGRNSIRGFLNPSSFSRRSKPNFWDSLWWNTWNAKWIYTATSSLDQRVTSHSLYVVEWTHQSLTRYDGSSLSQHSLCKFYLA